MQLKEQEHKQHRGFKVNRARNGFYSCRKLAHGKLNRSMRNAHSCHERRKLHHKCLEEMVLSCEQANQSLRRELETVSTVRSIC